MKNNFLVLKYLFLILIIVILFFLSICVGSVSISLKDVLLIFFKGEGRDTFTDIVMNIRLPRAISAFFVGGALALSGYSMQNFFRNPIAGPYILGISSGAKLLVALLFVFGAAGLASSYFCMIFFSFLGAIMSMAFVLLCSRRVQNQALLLVCGVMIGYICSAVTDFVVTFADDADIVNLHNWSKGSLSGMGWAQTVSLTLVVLLTSVFIFLLSKPMAAYMLGESNAKSLGVNVRLFRVLLILVSSLLASVVTAFAGPVSFVGIAVPQLVKGFLKESTPRKLIPACFIFGGAFTMLCDLIARMAFSPTELSISTVTAVFGAPVVIVMLVRRKMGGTDGR